MTRAIIFLALAAVIGAPRGRAESASVLVVPALECELPPGRAVVWTAAFPACWWKLAEVLKLPSLEPDPPGPWAARLNAARFDPSAVLPENAAYVAAGFATAEFREATQAEMQRRMGARMPKLEREWRDGGPRSVVAFCWMKQRLDFAPKFYRSRVTAMEFKTGSGEKVPVEFFGTTADLAPLFSKTVRVLQHDARGTVLSLRSSKEGEGLLLAARLARDDAKPVRSLSDAAAHILAQREAVARRAAEGGEPLHREFGFGDVLKVPVVAFDALGDYAADLAGAFRAPGHDEPLRIVSAWQRVSFELDETGAKVEALASIAASPFGEAPKPPAPRSFVFNEPFFVAAWRDDAPTPYFLARIDGAEVLKRWDRQPRQ